MIINFRKYGIKDFHKTTKICQDQLCRIHGQKWSLPVLLGFGVTSQSIWIVNIFNEKLNFTLFVFAFLGHSL